MNAVWIGIAAGATGIIALIVAFLADRRSRTAIERVDRVKNAPRAEGAVLRTRGGDDIAFGDLKARLTLLVNVPPRGADPDRMARLESIRHRFGPDTLDILAVPTGDADVSSAEVARVAGAVPVLASSEEHPLADVVADTFSDVDEHYTKLLIDDAGHVLARFPPEADPRGIELSRCIEDALKD